MRSRYLEFQRGEGRDEKSFCVFEEAAQSAVAARRAVRWYCSKEWMAGWSGLIIGIVPSWTEVNYFEGV